MKYFVNANFSLPDGAEMSAAQAIAALLREFAERQSLKGNIMIDAVDDLDSPNPPAP